MPILSKRLPKLSEIKAFYRQSSKSLASLIFTSLSRDWPPTSLNTCSECQSHDLRLGLKEFSEDMLNLAMKKKQNIAGLLIGKADIDTAQRGKAEIILPSDMQLLLIYGMVTNE
ncbi:hypothetical protein ACTXT7_010770 [Hymenolepis weldensis]